MKTYTLQQAQQLVADGAVIENDNKNFWLLRKLIEDKQTGGCYKYYTKNRRADFITDLTRDSNLVLIKLSQIQPEPIPNDVIKIVEKYGDKLLTYYELLKK